MVTCRSPKALLWVRVLPPVQLALVAQWIRAFRYGRNGWEFESLREYKRTSIAGDRGNSAHRCLIWKMKIVIPKRMKLKTVYEGKQFGQGRG